MEEYVLVLDSGLGGISVLKECIKQMPNENFLYVADSKNASYGNKSQARLNKVILKTINNVLKSYKVKLILFACNTATATSIKFIRSKIKLDIVGIEPAIKPAMEKGSNNILLLATKATLKYNNNLIVLKSIKPKNVFFVPLKKMAKKIDNNLNNLCKLESYVNKVLKPYKLKNINSVVLGCTHYNFIKTHIIKSFNKELLFFESNFATAKRVKFLLNQADNLKISGSKNIKIISTNNKVKLVTKLKKYIIKD